MKRGFWGRLDTLTRRMTPVFLALLMVVVSLIPTHIPGAAHVLPLLPLMAVYYWSVYRVELMPVGAVFAIGILQDVLSGAPIGANALALLLVHGIVTSQHRFLVGKSFFVVWLGFAVLSALAAFTLWILGALWNVSLLDLRAPLFQYALTLGAFPAVAWIFMRWQRAILRTV